MYLAQDKSGINTFYFLIKTRFGPNRPAADMEGNGEFGFLVIYEDFWINFAIVGEFVKIFGEFLKIFGEFFEDFGEFLTSFGNFELR